MSLLTSACYGQIDLRFPLTDQSDIRLHEELAAGEPATLKKTGLGPFGPGDGNPYVALLLRQRSPSFGDSGERPADGDLGWSAGVVRDKRRIGVVG